MFSKQNLHEWSRDRRGNVAMIFALASPVLILGAGMAMDYSLFTREKARLAMIADEASLAAVSNSAMYETTTQAQTLAQDIFNAQAAAVPRVTLSTSSPPSISITTSNAGLTRTATVSYTGTYSTIFGSALGISNLTISGTSVAQTTASANINFYVLLDNQGSMALPATQNGIYEMESLTPQQNPGGCAFACHEAAPNNPLSPFAADTQGNPCQPGTHGSNCPQIDNYTLARNNNIPLRFDQVTSAMSNLVSTATSLQNSANPTPTYGIAVYSVDGPYQQGLYNVMPLTTDYANQWSADASNLQLYTVYSDGAACASATSCASGVVTATESWSGQLSYNNVGFFSSPIGTEMQSLASTIPVSGSGANSSTPKNVLLIVTDGVEDTVIGNNLSITTWDSNALAACNTLKTNGVQVAILYTTYYPTPGFWLYDDYVNSFQSNIAPTLQSCASTGLFMTAAVGDNISQDLQTLFEIAAESPRLTQ